jgi:MoaA/NifB/PqqE/SkfB family radical SAM enzyme
MKPDYSTYCTLPFNHLAVEPNGDLKLCCLSEPFIPRVNINNQSLYDAYNSEQFKKARLDLQSGVKHSLCKICWEKEKLGMPSHRTEVGLPKNHLGEWTERTTDDGTIELDFEYIDIRFSNLCNFKCIMCNHDYSSTWYGNKEKEDGKPRVLKVRENFIEEIKPYIKNLKSVYFAGGEPLIMPEHFEILSYLHKTNKNIHIVYNTNLSVIKYDKTDLVNMWKDFDKVMVQVSLDGLFEIGETIRSGFDTKKFFENIKILKENNINYHIAHTTGSYNITNIFTFIKELYDNEIIWNDDMVSIANLVIYPKKYNIQLMSLDKKLEAKKYLEDNLKNLSEPRIRSQVLNLLKFLNIKQQPII